MTQRTKAVSVRTEKAQPQKRPGQSEIAHTAVVHGQKSQPAKRMPPHYFKRISKKLRILPSLYLTASKPYRS